MKYTYFDKPHAFSTYTTERSRCELCGETRAGYTGPFFGGADAEFVCEECMAAGRLRELGAMTNEGDIISLREQLRALLPDCSERQIQALERKRADELEHATPHLVTWQHLIWPAHCGDYCRFIKEVGLPDLENLASDGNGRRFFEDHLHGDDRRGSGLDNWWYGIRHDSPEDDSVPYDVGVWLFQCTQCGEYLIMWDAS